jgi:hypothetical protein
MLLLGGAVIASRALCAQPKAMPVIGFLGAGSGPSAPDPYLAAFPAGIKRGGLR